MQVPGRAEALQGDQLPVFVRREKLHFFGSDGKRV